MFSTLKIKQLKPLGQSSNGCKIITFCIIYRSNTGGKRGCSWKNA